jgi:cbb3-type cytochrome oxidase subunit 3
MGVMLNYTKIRLKEYAALFGGVGLSLFCLHQLLHAIIYRTVSSLSKTSSRSILLDNDPALFFITTATWLAIFVALICCVCLGVYNLRRERRIRQQLAARPPLDDAIRESFGRNRDGANGV